MVNRLTETYLLLGIAIHQCSEEMTFLSSSNTNSKPKFSSFMTGRPDFIFHKTENGTVWKWKGIKGNNRRKNGETGLSITQFINDNRRKIEEALAGPGAGIGIGCGVGVGFGLVGGIGYGDSGWDNFRMVFGVGMGCGVGAGFGYGNGLGSGISLESLRSRVFKLKPDPKRRLLI